MSILTVASSYVGAYEGSAEHHKIIDRYNDFARDCGEYIMTYWDPWCAAFASLCARQAGVKLPFSASCQRMVNEARARGTFQKTPVVGGFAMFDWDGDGVSDHVSIVSAINGETITTIGGNESNNVCVSSKPAKASYIMGYIRPLGENESKEPEYKTEDFKVGDIVYFEGSTHYVSSDAATGYPCKPGLAKITYTAPGAPHPYHIEAIEIYGGTAFGWVDPIFKKKEENAESSQPVNNFPEDLGAWPELKKGDEGRAVEALQALLLLRGYDVTKTGKFDEKTEKAVSVASKERLREELKKVNERLFKSLTKF